MAVWWKRWIGRAIGLTDAEFWSDYHHGESWSGEHVDEQGAMHLSAYWACVRLIAQTIATLPISVYERGANGEKRAVSQHDLYGLLHDSPNADQTAVEFWEGRMLGVCTSGNGCAEKMTAGSGRLISLERLPPETRAWRLESGAVEYRFVDRGKEEKLPESKVFHLRGFGDDLNGMSPVSYARQTLGLAQATEKAAAQVYSKGLRAKGFFTFPSKLTPEQREEARKNFAERYSAPNAPGVGILEAGVDFKSVNLSPKDAEMVLSRRFNVEDICRWHGVPPILVGHAGDGQTMWGSGVEQLMIGWLTLGLRPYLTRIEQRVKKSLLTPGERARGIFAEFSVEGLLRADSAARAELLSKMIQNAALKPNEWRALENRPPVEGGDRLFINSTLVPLDQAGQGASPAGAAPQ